MKRVRSLPEFSVAGAAKVYSTANVAVKSPSREASFSDQFAGESKNDEGESNEYASVDQVSINIEQKTFK